MTKTSIGVKSETLTKLKELKETYDFHSLNEVIELLVSNAKLLLLEKSFEVKKE